MDRGGAFRDVAVSMEVTRSLRVDRGASAPQDAAAFALGGSAPDAVLDAVAQCVFEALHLHRARGAHAAGLFNAHTVGWKEERSVTLTAEAIEHPRVFGVVVGDRDVVHVYRSTVRGRHRFPRDVGRALSERSGHFGTLHVTGALQLPRVVSKAPVVRQRKSTS